VSFTHTGCNSARFDYDSVVPGYGAGGYDYIRLTQLEGTAC
jgi:hypothetical protein